MTTLGATNVSGLVSGIDVDSIIQKLADLEAKQTRKYADQQSALIARQKAFQDVNTRLASFKDAATKLSASSYFSARTATVDNTNALVTAKSSAVPGQYAFKVDTLAQSHQLASQSYSDLTATRLGTGTFSIMAGSQTTSVALDSSNNTLGGLRDAINAAGTNVRASIIQDGTSSYRLMLSSKETGETNAMTISSSLSGGTGPTLTTLQAAQDATVTLGSGPGAITARRASNNLQDVIPGVTVNIASVTQGSRLNISVTQDTSAIEAGAKAFVDQYNNLQDFIIQQSKFNADTNSGGVLLGDFTLRGIQSEVQNVISSAVTGVSSGFNSLADVGISLGGDGKMTLDSATFQAKLAESPEGVTRLFALTGSSTNAGVQFLGATTYTDTVGATYAVNITQPALQARVTAGSAQSDVLAADETLTINGISIALTSGMSRSAVVDAINSRSSQTGVSARSTALDGTGSGEFITLTTAAYGGSAKISVVSTSSNSDSSPLSSGFGNTTATEISPEGESGAGTGNVGQSVAGTINGEAATGSGQVLTGNRNNPHTDGLRLRVTAAAAGSLGNVKVYSGMASMTQQTLARLTDIVSGPLTTEQDALQTRVDDLQKVIDKLNDRVASNSDLLRAKFNKMEAILGQLNAQSDQLKAQFNKSKDN